MDTAITQPMYGWNQINWKKVDRKVFKLQKRIYRASLRGDVLLHGHCHDEKTAEDSRRYE